MPASPRKITPRILSVAPVLMKWSLSQKLNATERLIKDHLNFVRSLTRIRMYHWLLQPLTTNGTQGPAPLTELRQRRTRALIALRDALETHFYIEEEVILPELNSIPSLKSHPKSVLEEHKNLRAIIKELSHPGLAERPFERKLHALSVALHQHIRHEEREILPVLVNQLSPARLLQLGHQMMNMKKPPKIESAA